MSRHNDPPYFPFYPDDFACDGKVEAMTTEEIGAYTLLLCKAWCEDPPGSIPDDDRVLARWTRLAPDRWKECRTGVLAAFTLGTDSSGIKNRCVGSMRNSGSSSRNAWGPQEMPPMPDMEEIMRPVCGRHANRMRRASVTNAFHLHIHIQK
jgi:uncharacterized protein YdaU (DUF1376 family)